MAIVGATSNALASTAGCDGQESKKQDTCDERIFSSAWRIDTDRCVRPDSRKYVYTKIQPLLNKLLLKALHRHTPSQLLGGKIEDAIPIPNEEVVRIVYPVWRPNLYEILSIRGVVERAHLIRSGIDVRLKPHPDAVAVEHGDRLFDLADKLGAPVVLDVEAGVPPEREQAVFVRQVGKMVTKERESSAISCCH